MYEKPVRVVALMCVCPSTPKGGGTARALVERGYAVRALVRNPARAANLPGVELLIEV